MRKWMLSVILFVLVNFGLCLSSASAQQPAMKWIFAGSEAGTTTYDVKADGTFESVTEFNIAGTVIKSKLVGRFVDGKLVEYEIVRNAQGEEIKTVARDGKAKISTKDRTRESDYKPSSVLFANFHPIMLDSIIKAYDQAKGGVQTIEVTVVDGGVTTKIDVSKKKTHTVESGGKKQVLDIYLLRLSSVDIDLYIADNSQVAGMEVAAQKIKVIRVGFENAIVDPTTLYPELSQPAMQTKSEKNSRIKMRDGTELAADIFRPAVDGKYSAILVRTPYGRQQSAMVEGEWWAKRGYVYIAQDVRGRNDSDGEWNPFVNERRDGYDTIDWIAKQAWSDGKVGMIGGSYLGYVQWTAAAESHPALKCIVPQVSPPDMFFNFPIDHGIPMLYSGLMWMSYVKEKKITSAFSPIKDADKLLTLPLSKVDDAVLGQNFPYFDQWLGQETHSSFTSANYMQDMNKIKIPVLHISGWWDGDGIGTKMNWARLRSLGHKNQWLIYGPWSHLFNASTRIGDTDYGPDAILDLDSIYLRFFDQYLKGKPVKWESQPKVRVFVTGANEWRAMDDWPDGRSKEVALYFNSTEPANGKASKGKLTKELPKQQKPDRYSYDPADSKVPDELKQLEQISASAGNTEMRLRPEDRDLLVYKSEPMAESLEIGGPIEVDLYFSTSAKDTDFFAFLVDVDEKDVIRVIGLPGKIRARYISGWDKPSLLQPGKTYKATLELWDTAHRFKKGHRVGLVISSSYFPSYARNLNTGEPIKDATRMVVAHQTIYHDAKRPSALRFRLLPPSNNSEAQNTNPVKFE